MQSLFKEFRGGEKLEPRRKLVQQQALGAAETNCQDLKILKKKKTSAVSSPPLCLFIPANKECFYQRKVKSPIRPDWKDARGELFIFRCGDCSKVHPSLPSSSSSALPERPYNSPEVWKQDSEKSRTQSPELSVTLGCF